MGRAPRAAALLLVLTGCGSPPAMVPVGFRNLTQHSDATLRALWCRAQISVGTQVDLNPLQRSFEDVPADIRPGDARAMEVMPHQLPVAAEPDVLSEVLLSRMCALLRPGG